MIHLPVRSYVSNHYTDSNVRIRTHHQPVLRLSKYDLRLSRAPILHGEHTERSVIFSGDACRPRVTGINSAPKILIIRGAKREYGALGGIRTHDLSLRRAALYPAELQAHKCGRIHVLNFTSIKTNLVPRARVELARPCGHYALNVARLPFRHLGTRVQIQDQRSMRSEWWAMKDSNLRPPACKAGALTN